MRSLSGARNGRFGPVMRVKAKFSERPPVATSPDDCWALNVTSVSTETQTQEKGQKNKTKKLMQRSRIKQKMQKKVKMMNTNQNPNDSCKPLCTWRGLCCGCYRKCTRITDKKQKHKALLPPRGETEVGTTDVASHEWSPQKRYLFSWGQKASAWGQLLLHSEV